MSKFETSKSLDGQSELVLRMPVKKGLVKGISTKTYKHRLADITKLFSDLRIASRESRLTHPFSDVVDRIQTIQAVHIAVAGDHLVLSVAFDQPWEPYIRDVWRVIGKLLDVILLNCEGYLRTEGKLSGGHSSDLGFKAFELWIRKNQINTDTFYINQDQTVRDVIYLEELERQIHTRRNTDRFDTQSFIPETPEQSASQQRAKFKSVEQYIEYLKLGVKAMTAFHGMTYTYAKGGQDHDYLLKAVRDVLRVEGVGDVTSVDAEFPRSDTWLTPGAAGIALDENVAFSEAQIGQIKTLLGVFNTEISWFEKTEYRNKDPETQHAPQTVELDQVQGGILNKYESADTGCLIMAQVQDAALARSFLDQFSATITRYTDDHNTADSIFRNIAFSYSGLQRLGVTDTELEEMPAEFQQGMASRAGLIGDVRGNHPDHWPMAERNWPIDSANRAEVDVSSVDIVIQIRACTGSYHSDFNADHPLYDEIVQLEKNADGALLILSVQPMGTLPDKLGHFGFKDGISQPQFALQHPAAPKLEGPSYPADLPLPAGELFLGHKNSRNDPDGGTSFSKLRRDGTFLVIRKMAQDVAALDSMVEHNQKSGSRDEILGQLLGRYPDGRPLPDTAKGNEFDYDSDPDGKTVPLYSHIRRTNPRKSPHKGDLPDPRILRRGMSFGSTFSQADAQTPRGLIFQAYNASIAEQFEVIQRWISGGNETSPYSRLNDPLFGVRHIRDHDRNYPAHLNGTAKDLEKIDKPFASLHWGLYLFVPSLKGLREIVNSSPTSSASDAELARGQALINEILSMEQEGRLGEARNYWKAILEDSAYQENGDNLAVWRAIRDAHSGALKTKTFGTLVADKNLIYEVLGKLDTYNVEKYHERLEQTSGINYLGLPKEEHAAQSREANGYMSEISYEVALEEAFQIATGALAPLGKLGKSATIPLPKYIDLALAYVCRNRFGIPEDGTDSIFQTGGEPLVGSTTVHCPYHVYSTSRYVFQPEPEEHVKKTAITEGNQMKAAVIKYLSSGAELTAWSQGLKDRLTANGKGDLFPQVLLGALLGFLPSANGNFLQTMGEWIRTDEFWRVRNTYLSLLNKGQVAEAREFVRKSFGRTMGMVPVPGIIHRTASVKTALGSHSIEAGDHIVLGLISATAAEPDNSDVDPIFGGIYTGETHACPGRNLALGTQIGVTCALLSLPGALLRTPSEYALDYRPLEQPGSA